MPKPDSSAQSLWQILVGNTITPLNLPILPNVCDPFWMGDIITPIDLPKLGQKYPNTQTQF